MATLGAGYNQLFTPNADTVFVDGYIQVGSDGYTVSTDPLPREIDSLTHNGTGDYTLVLKQCWYDLLFVAVTPELSTGSSPAILFTQVVSNNVGTAGTVDGEQGVRFKLINTSGSAANLPASGGFTFLLVLKRTGA